MRTLKERAFRTTIARLRLADLGALRGRCSAFQRPQGITASGILRGDPHTSQAWEPGIPPAGARSARTWPPPAGMPRRASAAPGAPGARKSPARPGRTGLWKRRLAARYFPALLSAVSSPRGLLTAVFGMGTGVSAQQGPPTKGFRPENTRRGSHVRQDANARARLLQRSPPSRPLSRASRRGAADKPHGLSEPLG